MKIYDKDKSLIAEGDFTYQGGRWISEELIIEDPNGLYIGIDVPKTITPRQIRQQLTAIGLRQTVEDLISASTDYDLKDWWNHSQEFERSHPVLGEMGEKLGMSEDDMDSFFIEASKL